eukprot:6235055-Alexandrium_andersonii.AAC.1
MGSKHQQFSTRPPETATSEGAGTEAGGPSHPAAWRGNRGSTGARTPPPSNPDQKSAEQQIRRSDRVPPEASPREPTKRGAAKR